MVIQEHELDTLDTVVKIIQVHLVRNVVIIVDYALFPQLAVEVVRVRVQKCSDSKTGMSAYILELVESNRSAYSIYWITCDVNRKRSIRGKYYRTRNGRKGLYPEAMGTRDHKITIQAMWQLFLQQLIDSGIM